MELTNKNLVRRRFPRSLIIKAPGLLPMWYAPTELAEEVGVAAFTVREWVKFGLSHRRDETGHIWINGKEFAGWVADNRSSPKSHALGPGQAFASAAGNL